MMKNIFIRWSKPLTFAVVALAIVGTVLSLRIQLKLSLMDLLPEDHPGVVKFKKLTEVVGGVGYFAVVLEAEDGKSHLEIAPQIVEDLKKSNLVRSAFFQRERKFFMDRLLYYGDIKKLQELEANIGPAIMRARQEVMDLGLFEREKPEDKKPAIDPELQEYAKKSANTSPYLIHKDQKKLLIMVKPDFDSTDLAKTKELIAVSDQILKNRLPANVTYEYAERYYANIVESKMVEGDILVLGTLSLALIVLVIFIYLRSILATLSIFIPVLCGMGITIGFTYLFIGDINIITGFLMGIISGLGVDYAIHLYLRLRMELVEPSSSDPDPIWRTIASSGHSVFVGAAAASGAFFFLCMSSFRAFSEFGFICGVGILSVLSCILICFSTFARWFKLDRPQAARKTSTWKRPLPVLGTRPKFYTAVGLTAVSIAIGTQVGFEFDLNKMMQFSKKTQESYALVDNIYGRSAVPSAIAASSKEEALAIENLIKTKYMPGLVSELVSGASIVPDDQQNKQKLLVKIEDKIKTLNDRWIEKGLGVPAKVVRAWLKSTPFGFSDLPTYTQESLRGTKQSQYLLYAYSAVDLNSATNILRFADMLKDVEKQFPEALIGSDAVIFSEILDLVIYDGGKILAIIVFSVFFFMWINIRNWKETVLSYIPLLISLPVGMGLMRIFDVKFNIFNVAIIPTFVAMGIDVPIHIVHRSKETGSGFKAARDLASSINLALLTAGVGFGVLVFARAGVLKSLGWIALLGTVGIWWVGLFLLPAYLEFFGNLNSHDDGEIVTSVDTSPDEPTRALAAKSTSLEKT